MSLNLLNVCSRNVIDRLPHLPGRGTRQIYSNALLGHDRRDLWSTSIGVHYEAQMGHDWMDALLCPRYPCVLVLPAFVFLLEDGRFLMGSNACCLGRIWKEDDCSCQFAFPLQIRLYETKFLLFRTKANSTPDLFL